MSRLNYSLTQLEYVMAVHKYGHFAKAAEACGVTQPTLSMQIQKLEQEWAVVIFDRSKKPILITEIGQKIIHQVQSILFEARKVDEIVQMSKSKAVSGQLAIGIIPTIAPYLLPSLLKTLADIYPKIELEIHEFQTERIIEALGQDEIDVGLLATPLNVAHYYEYPLYYEPFSFLCRKNHPLGKAKKIKYADLKSMSKDIWLLEEGHCLRNQVLDICSLKKNQLTQHKYRFQSGSLETLINLVDSVGGFTFLPSLATKHIGAHSTLIQFERPIPAREIGLIYRREHYKSQLIEALGETIIKSIPENLRKIRPKDLAVIPVDG